MDDLIAALYIVAFALLHRRPAHAARPAHRGRGNQVAAVGMAIAVIATLLDDRDRRLAA